MEHEGHGVERVERIFNFVTMDDTRDLIAHALKSKAAVISGGSFIAYELAEGLNVRGVHVTWLMRGPFWLRTVLDPAGGQLVDDIASAHGVEVVHGESIAEAFVRISRETRGRALFNYPFLNQRMDAVE